MPYVDRLKTSVAFNWYRYGAIVAAGFGLFGIREIPGARGALPEPFDVMNHVGNMSPSITAGYIAGMACGSVYADRNNNEISKRRLRTAMAGGALAAGVVINGLVETKLGISISHWQNTTDPLDFVYGTVSAVAAGTFAPEIQQTSVSEYTYSRDEY